MREVSLAAFAACCAATFAAFVAVAADRPPSLSVANVVADDDAPLRVESVTTRVTAYSQFGTGYQSKAGPTRGPGSERMTVFEPQTEMVATQGPRITHRLWVPVDVVSAASPSTIPKRVDVVSGASRHNVGGSVQWTTAYAVNPETQLAMTNGIHLEEPFRSWNGALAARRAFADQNTVVAGGVVAIFDWFDRFRPSGVRSGRAERSSTMASLGVTQVLSSTTIANVNYGLTLQAGELGNTWNAVPLASGERGPEILPGQRVRHALVGRISQFLPWNGALRAYYRFYADDWGIVAHSVEGQLMQRLTSALYVGGLYRFHRQTGPAFFTTFAPAGALLRVADSDLAPLDSQTVGAKIVGEVPVMGAARALHVEVEYDRYVRTNDLRMDIVTCSLGLRF